MNLLGLETAIRDRLGLDPGSLGASVFPRAIELRMRARGVTAPEAYQGVLATDPAEVDALADELVVPETWFFRGGRSLFDRLAEFVATRAARSGSSPVRILSSPCSTGEEVYSLAIALRERLLPPEQYQLDAVDISARHLQRATEGRFTSFAFREAGTDIRPTHFRHQDDRWDILPHFRRLVRFRNGNVTDPAFLAGESPYDLILCRNLFIYLTPEGRRRGMATLDRMLALDGWLCLTPGEADRLPPSRFAQEGPPEFGIYRRVESGSALVGRVESSRPDAAVKRAPVVIQKEDAAAPPALRRENPPRRDSPPQPPPVASLEAARELANAGRLAEARAACERSIQEHADSAAAYTLLGVIHQAEGHTAEAIEAFRRALYLAPDQPEALSHMIVICDTRGDATQAAALRRRLARTAREEAT